MPSKSVKSFRTHSNYLRAFARLTDNQSTSVDRDIYELLKERILQADALPQRHQGMVDLSQVAACLHIAWGTEAILLASRAIDEEGLIRLSNNWSVIQGYYILYHCIQALHVAKGHPRPQSHPTSQNLFYDYWSARMICLPPWSLAFGVDGARNLPAGHRPDISIHPWSSCIGNNIYDLALKALMTTRREALSEKRHERRIQKQKQNRRSWREEEEDRLSRGRRPRKVPSFPLPILTGQDKRLLDGGLRPYTIMDYLFRLRIKTNYEDSNMFTDGPEDDFSSRQIRNELCLIASGTLFLHELAIYSLVDGPTFLSWVDEWIRRNNPQGAAQGVAVRRRHFI
jgi:hypothetical protein